MSDATTKLNTHIHRIATDQGISCDEYTCADTLLTDILLTAGRIDKNTAAKLLEEACNTPFIDPAYISFAPEFLDHAGKLLPHDFICHERVFPIRQEGNILHLIMASPLDHEARIRLETLTGCRLQVYCCHGRGIDDAIATHFPLAKPDKKHNPQTLVDAVLHVILQNRDHLEPVEAALALASNVHIILLVQNLLQELATSNTSDIHIEPQATCLRLRVRRDGILQTIKKLPSSLAQGIIARLKLMAKLDLAVQDHPQDGRIDYQVIAGRNVDIRISSLPTLYGENIVLRLLDKGTKRITLDAMALPAETLQQIRAAIRQPNGLVLITGPTGSGKTSTLYACLEEINREEIKISTVEDPVEYELAGTIQVNCDEASGLTFVEVLRSLLRQDPDVLMIGEIRDYETADIAVKAATTGHLVFATMHTNDAPSTITRLVNLGIPPFLVASCGLSVIAQRLLRKVCTHCARKTQPTADVLKQLQIEFQENSFLQGTGCENCGGTGYKGRLPIMEILNFSDTLEKLVLSKSSAGELRRAAISNGMVTLYHAAIQRCLDGQTTPEEVIRLTLDI